MYLSHLLSFYKDCKNDCITQHVRRYWKDSCKCFSHKTCFSPEDRYIGALVVLTVINSRWMDLLFCGEAEKTLHTKRLRGWFTLNRFPCSLTSFLFSAVSPPETVYGLHLPLSPQVTALIPAVSLFLICCQTEVGSVSGSFRPVMDKSDVCSSAGMPTLRRLQSERVILTDSIWAGCCTQPSTTNGWEAEGSQTGYFKALTRAQIRRTSVLQSCEITKICYIKFGALTGFNGI